MADSIKNISSDDKIGQANIEESPDQAKLLERQKQQCLFCKICNKEIPSQIVYEDELFMCVLDINPAAKGHVLVIPKQHIGISPQLSQAHVARLGVIIQAITQALNHGLGFKNMNMLISNGVLAGQRSPHLVIHLIPREEGDNIKIAEETPLTADDVKQLQGLKPLLNKVFIQINQISQGLKVVQSQDCEICRYIKQALAYSNSVSVITMSQGFSRAHLRVVPTSHYTILQQLPIDILTLMLLVSNITSALLFELFAKQGIELGTNILIRNGIPAGQTLNHVSIEVIARFKNDKPILEWKPLDISKADLEEIRTILEEEIRLMMDRFKQQKQGKQVIDKKQDERYSNNKTIENRAVEEKTEPEPSPKKDSKFLGKTPWDRIP